MHPRRLDTEAALEASRHGAAKSIFGNALPTERQVPLTEGVADSALPGMFEFDQVIAGSDFRRLHQPLETLANWRGPAVKGHP